MFDRRQLEAAYLDMQCSWYPCMPSSDDPWMAVDSMYSWITFQLTWGPIHGWSVDGHIMDIMYSWITFPLILTYPPILGWSMDGSGYNVFMDYFPTDSSSHPRMIHGWLWIQCILGLLSKWLVMIRGWPCTGKKKVSQAVISRFLCV